MRYILLFLALSFFLIDSTIGQTLNQYGHINTPSSLLLGQETAENQNVVHNKGELSNTDAIKVGNKFILLRAINEDMLFQLRINDLAGNELFSSYFSEMANLLFSANKHFMAFRNKTELVVMNLMEISLRSYPTESTAFSIDNEGQLIYYEQSLKGIMYKNNLFPTNTAVLSIQFYQNEPLIFTRYQILKLSNQKTELLLQLPLPWFESKIVNDDLYYVLKERSQNELNFYLFKSDLSTPPIIIDQQKIILEVDVKRNATINDIEQKKVKAPLDYFQDTFEHKIPNSYLQYQSYDTYPVLYTHPGIDLLGEPFQNVYAVHDGEVKAVLTTQLDAHWRVAISNEFDDNLNTGYLYAHLNESSITVQVGDSVKAGDLLGTLYPWEEPTTYTHCHFARILSSGETWSNWNTIDNPAAFISNLRDKSNPVFEPALIKNGNEQMLAFRRNDNIYLDPLNLNGSIQMIAKCYDLTNTEWKAGVHKLRYKLIKIENENKLLIINALSFIINYESDYYQLSADGPLAFNTLSTIYSMDDVCKSKTNYIDRELYYILTNTNGDSILSENDKDVFLNTALYPDGDYIFEATAIDASGNSSTVSMPVKFVNGNTTGTNNQINEFDLQVSPNPTGGVSTIKWINTKSGTKTAIHISDLLGRNLFQVCDNEFQEGVQEIRFDASGLKKGLYLLVIKNEQSTLTQKLIID